MTNELLEKAKACKSAEELLSLAKENGYPMTAEEAAAKYAELHTEGELSDDELDSAAGGACNSEGRGGHTIIAGTEILLLGNKACPHCGATQARLNTYTPRGNHNDGNFTCSTCGRDFTLSPIYSGSGVDMDMI